MVISCSTYKMICKTKATIEGHLSEKGIPYKNNERGLKTACTTGLAIVCGGEKVREKTFCCRSQLSRLTTRNGRTQ